MISIKVALNHSGPFFQTTPLQMFFNAHSQTMYHWKPYDVYILSQLDALQIQFQAMTRNSFKTMPYMGFSLW